LRSRISRLGLLLAAREAILLRLEACSGACAQHHPLGSVAGVLLAGAPVYALLFILPG